MGTAGCDNYGANDFDPLEGYVSVKEAHEFFQIEYGIPRWNCEGHGPVDRTAFNLARANGEEPEEALYSFVSCETIYIQGRRAREDGLFPGQELTFGLGGP